MKILRRIFNKDEKVGESILSKIDDNIFVEKSLSGVEPYVFEIDNFNINIYRKRGFDVTSGSSWYDYTLKVDNISLKVSKYIMRKIFEKADHICHREEYKKQNELKEEKRMIYKDIKVNFNNARR